MYYRDDFLQKMQRKFGKLAIQNLMMYIVGAMAVVFAATLAAPAVDIIGMFIFDTAAIMQGQVWRVITFIFIPPNLSLFFIIFALYLYWLFGSALEGQWGSFRFNAFYLCGIIGTIIAGLITGYATNFYLNLSLMLAFAALFPNFEIRLFFILPVKIKWLAYINLAFLAFDFITSSWPLRLALVASLLNLVLFFGKDFIARINNKRRKAEWNRTYRR